MRAEKWLKSLRFNCETEPTWISGQKPDFHCTGPSSLWVEVKTLGSESRFERLADAHAALKTRTSTISACAQAVAWVKPPLEPRDAKVVVSLAKRALTAISPRDESQVVLALVPEDPNYGRFVRYSFSTEDGKTASIFAIESKIGRYAWPTIVTPSDYRQGIEVLKSDGTSESTTLRTITTFDERLRVAMQLLEGKIGFELIATVPIGGAAKVNTVSRIRNSVSEANSQSKNACRYKQEPALTVIFHDDLLVSEDEMVVAALYGDLAYSFSAQRFQDAELIFTQNGIFSPNKNRTTSAVAYVRNDARYLFVHNLWAYRPLRPDLFPGRHIVPSANGHFDIVEQA